jgi:hypothetical protein
VAVAVALVVAVQIRVLLVVLVVALVGVIQVAVLAVLELPGKEMRVEMRVVRPLLAIVLMVAAVEQVLLVAQGVMQIQDLLEMAAQE